MTPPATLFHALLRPCVLQILRATGYHATRPAVLDALTELAVRYLVSISRLTAQHTLLNSGVKIGLDGLPEEDDNEGTLSTSIVDVRMALEEVGAFGVVDRFIEPEEGDKQESTWRQRPDAGDDARGVEEFVAWFAGVKCRAIREMAVAGLGDGVTATAMEGESLPADYLNALMSKHSKSAEDSKFHGTILGKGNDSTGEIHVEGGGDASSIEKWRRMMRGPSPPPPLPSPSRSRTGSVGSRPPSSGLSSVGSRLGEMDMEMDLS